MAGAKRQIRRRWALLRGALLLLCSLAAPGDTQRQPDPAEPSLLLLPAESDTSALDSDSAAGILVANRGLRVPFGRSVSLDPARDLVIRVQPGDKCVLTVLESGPPPAPHRPGALFPKRFACDFGPGEVTYTHYGSRSPSRDRLSLQLRYDSPSRTLVAPFTLEAEVLSQQLRLLSRNLPLTVEKLHGLSPPLDAKVLAFAEVGEPGGRRRCRLTTLPYPPSSRSYLPAYGRLVDANGRLLPPAYSNDCSRFLDEGIRYEHTATTPSPNRDYVPMRVEVSEQDGDAPESSGEAEYFQVVVRIREGAENTPPKPSFVALLMMEVDQFVLTAITPDMLAAEDQETPSDLLFFNLTSPWPSTGGQDRAGSDDPRLRGYLISTDDPSRPLTSFTQQEVRELKIAYQPPTVDSDHERLFQLEMEVLDPEGASSEPFAFMVVVKPMNTLAPVAVFNRIVGPQMMLFEGQSRPLSDNLEISDEDNLDEVKVWVTRGLKHGELRVLGASPGRQFFTAAELEAGQVIYQHDGSEHSYSDNIVFRMGDGRHQVEFLYPITIAPYDDQPPLLNANTGLVLSEHQVVQISPFVLSATDIDSEDSTIRFVLKEVEGPPDMSTHQRLGELLLRQTEIPLTYEKEEAMEGDHSGTSWHFVESEGVYEKEVTEWVQQDILDGKLFYRHTGPHSTNLVMDRFVFYLQDDNDPPNQSGEQVFIIKVQPVDNLPPELYPGTTLQMTVLEYQVTHFRKRYLRYTDLDTDDRELKYTVLTPPTDTDENHPVLAGEIVLIDNPLASITHFTQAQINHHKVAYRPPAQELGITPRVVQFTYSVEDTAGNSVLGTFTLFLQPVDNQPPQITNAGFTVSEGGSFLLTSSQLDATDKDTDTDRIVFTLTEAPQHGHLCYLEEGLMVQGESFLLDDIANGRISYQHSGDEYTGDSFQLEVSDGVHQVPITVKIAVQPVDDERPSISLPGSNGLLGAFIDVLENSATEITTSLIQGTDEDTDELALTFIVEDPPKLGDILVDGVPSRRFTQQDLISGTVVYAHIGGEIGLKKLSDSFNLTISDLSSEWVVGGSTVEGVRVTVTILPVDNIAPEIMVGEEPFTIYEGGKNVLSLQLLDVEDVDTPRDDILCTILIQTTSGYLENISPALGSEKSRAGTPISAFSIKDVRLGHINYVQSIHKGVEPLEDRFTFHCSDGINFSPHQFFPIVIIPTNDEKPELFVREFVVLEGMSLVIDTPILNGADGDIPPDELRFFVTVPPKHGQIVNQLTTGTVSVHNFTLEEIREASSIVYEHDDSETKEDTFKIQLTDGLHTVEQEVLIMVILVDDETPRMSVNDGLDVEIGESKVITNRDLQATDIDSEDKMLTYIIRLLPRHGLLQRMSKEGQVLGNITLGMNFTQDEIDQGCIRYLHTGQQGVRDLVKFDVTDGINPLIDRYFYITISSIDMVFPEVINKGVTLKEGGKVTLTTDLLSTSDINSPDEHLQFSITRAPSRGHLENSDSPGVPVTTFTQLQLAGNKIYYIHTAEDEVKMDSFEFEVTDGYNPVFRTFRVSITDVDNKKPVLTIHDLTIQEGETKLITPFELNADDRDTPDHLLRFIITQVPVHGQIIYNNSYSVTSFTKQDLNENMITYRHDGTETSHDSFSFTVTDGTHSVFYVFPDTILETRHPQMMKIQIISLDNGVPQIVVNKGASTLRHIPKGHLGFLITSKSLKAEDRDSSHKLLKYKITDGPKHGLLINTGLGNGSVKAFTQADIDDMKICYILKDGENATSDIFYFSIEDSGGNKLKSQPFRLNWAWISLEKEYYTVDEDSRVLEVTLQRRGYLGETSFISIGTKDGTAEKDKDFKGKAQKQVQFNPGQTVATWRVRIIVDNEYEESEIFQIILSDPVMAALEFPERATVEIVDPGDESTVYIPASEYRIEEDVGELLIPVRRSGDVSHELMVICSTHQGSATGTIPSTVLSYSDYISLPEDHTSLIRFDKGETEKTCRVIIIDDSLYEEDETFNVTLSMPMGGQIGTEFPGTKVIILADTDDEPAFYFGDTEYHVVESAGYVEVRVWRTGTDLSKAATVTVRSRKTEPISAEAGVDYVGISRNLDFAPGVNMQTFRVTILDDLGQPVLEGPEKFELVLRMPTNAILGEPSKTTIFINDTITDLPRVQFKEPLYTVNEKDGQMAAIIYRSGDVNYKSTVRCYTRQGSAQVMMDYEERPNTDDSVVVFVPGEIEKSCVVVLEDDAIYEEEEEFRLVLGTPKSTSAFGASVGEQKETLVKIKDEEDKPVIKFSEIKYSIQEPQEPGETSVVKIPVLRVGDSSKVSIVRVHTKDGSATSGEDYNPISDDIEFKEGEMEHHVEVEVLYDGVREMREAFSVHLKPDENMVAETQMNKAMVYIEEMDSVADVTFPAVPQVVSLLLYDDTPKSKGNPHPPTGYPVVCVTACNPKYSDYDKTGSICAAENINDTLTLYRWLVSAPSGSDGVTSPMREVDSNTFFTNTKSIALDSIYFQAGSRVQCAARAVNANGDMGLELLSPIYTINREEGLCQPRIPGTVGAEPFSAKIRYTGPDDPDYPNLIKLTVTMPHMDGMLPVVSTRPLSNFELTLSPDGTRVGNHKCSNLLDYNEIETNYGFITEDTKNPEVIGETSPYQYSSTMRSAKTLRFYRSLNLEACLWEFNSYYDMSELLTDCSGSIGTDGQVLNLVQSYVTLRVPLYVSYVFHSPAAVGGWQHFDLQSELKLTFVYDTAILWKDGIGSPPEAELQGSLYPTSMQINDEGRLVVYFRTEIRFRGQFVMSHPGTSLSSMVMSADHPGLTFTLSLSQSEQTFHQPMQQWKFISDFAIRDYSGTYTVKLIPCIAAPSQEYTQPVICSPREPITFDLDIRFQQVSDPVAAEFSLNTQMFLLSKKDLWLSDGSMGFGEGTDVAFTEGSEIYGRVMVDPVQNLGESFICNIEKVFLCTGADGYVPKYNPNNKEYGCLADSPSLLYRFKVLDKAQPDTQAKVFGNMAFHAKLAVDHIDGYPLVKQSGSDGFSLLSTPLFQVAAGREWYIHTIYMVRSRENAHRGLGKRSLGYHHLFSSANGISGATHTGRTQRAISDVPDLAQDITADNNRGTNIQHIALDRSNKIVIEQKEQFPAGKPYEKPVLEITESDMEDRIVPIVGGAAGLLLLISSVLSIIFLLKRKGRSTDGKAKSCINYSSSNETVTTQHSNSDSSEV
ncbi:FRAS1-related extracellular matrix protein 3 isoform X1 [Rhineura floridana]|uniref:FRAS1-related extracellular matrix protein 3 isoform X1 n=1 Tax=Rhineura floridana TaxID=261503 RepID=UPI002AC7EF1D|nr:FRAS1-related extracellular matrix protein 3 isoform X1 [Rhineura floridana]